MKRELEKALDNLIFGTKKNSVTIVEGARQVGKSYIVDQVLKKHKEPVLSFDLEKSPKVRRQIEETEDFEDFKTLMEDQFGLKGNSNSVLFIDEAQESKQLAKYVKSLKEDLSDVKVVLTGSSMNRFFPKETRIPVGRYRSICIFGFSFSEFVEYVRGEELADFLRSSPDKIPASRHTLMLELYDDYIKVGGYPEAIIAYSEKERWISVIDEIMSSLEEDFERKEEYQPQLFRDTVSAISNHIGSPSKLTHFNTTKYHAKNIISALRKWHVALEIEQKSITPDKGGDFLPKRYLHDIGIVNRKRSIGIPEISILDTLDMVLRTPLGALFENALLIQLMSGESASYSVSTWKKGNNTDIEVDFIFEYSDLNVNIPIECKATLQVKSKHYKNIIHYLSLTNQEVGVLVSAAPYEVIKKDSFVIINLPIYLASKNNIAKYVEKYLR